MRWGWEVIVQELLNDPHWSTPTFPFAAVVIVRAAEGSPVPVTLPVTSNYAPWSWMWLLEAAHRVLHTPQDSTGTRMIDTVGEEVYFGGFSQMDCSTLALRVVTRQEARGQFSSNL